MTIWQASASLPMLQERANLLAAIRSFFAGRGVLEVDTPALALFGVTDRHLENIEARVNGQIRYLQTSPEYFLKRLLAMGAGPVYYLGKAFRDEETGPRHHPEFTLLEWYRPGWDEQRLMAEIAELLAGLSPAFTEPRQVRYGELFEAVTGLNPHTADLALLREAAARICAGDWQAEDRATCLDALFSLAVEPTLADGVVFIRDYPVCQAALATLAIDTDGVTVARRFEVFINGMELGNGYFELTDAVEQRRRFVEDCQARRAAGKTTRAIDERLLSALEAGLPACAGVAIGVDRLLMQLVGETRIDAVLPFVD